MSSGMGLQGAADEQLFIENWFLEGWGDRTPVAMPGALFDPDDYVYRDGWVRLTIRRAPIGAQRADVGTTAQRALYRFLGTIIVDAFSPVDRGMTAVIGMVDDAATVFRVDSPAPGLRFEVGQPRELPDDGRWARAVVEIPFERDTIFEQR